METLDTPSKLRLRSSSPISVHNTAKSPAHIRSSYLVHHNSREPSPVTTSCANKVSELNHDVVQSEPKLSIHINDDLPSSKGRSSKVQQLKNYETQSPSKEALPDFQHLPELETDRSDTDDEDDAIAEPLSDGATTSPELLSPLPDDLAEEPVEKNFDCGWTLKPTDPDTVDWDWDD